MARKKHKQKESKFDSFCSVFFSLLALVVAGMIVFQKSPEKGERISLNKPIVDAVQDIATEGVTLSTKIPLKASHEKQVECLARNIYFEARSESVAGQLAVALVTLNRSTSGLFPKTMCGVVYQKTKGVCQFSWVCLLDDKTIRNKKKYKEIKQLAEEFYISYVVNGNKPLDITDGATYYHADYVSPKWSRVFEKTITIGQHIFYRS